MGKNSAPDLAKGHHPMPFQIPPWAALSAPLAILLFCFLLLPVWQLLRISFLAGDRSFEAEGYGTEHYVRFLSDSYYISVMFDTLGYGLATAALCLILGFPMGYAMARMKPAWRRVSLIVIVLPLTLSLVVVVFGWLVVLGRNGIVNDMLIGIGLTEHRLRLLFNSPAVIFVLAQQFLPFMVLSIMSVVSQIDPALEQAAANLRASRRKTFRRIILPLAAPGILSGFTLVFVLSASAFITPRLIGGFRVQMVGSLIFEQIIVILNWPFGAAMATILFIETLTTTFAANRVIARLNR